MRKFQWLVAEAKELRGRAIDPSCVLLGADANMVRAAMSSPFATKLAGLSAQVAATAGAATVGGAGRPAACMRALAESVGGLRRAYSVAKPYADELASTVLPSHTQMSWPVQCCQAIRR